MQPYSRQRELQESYLNIFYLPIFDRFMAYGRSKSNFGPNVIYCFLGLNESICYSFLQAWQWVEKHKFHGLVGPPGAIFEKSNNLQNQEGKFRFSRMALYHVLKVPEYSRHSQLQESCLNIVHLRICDGFVAYRRSQKKIVPTLYLVFFSRFHSPIFISRFTFSYFLIFCVLERHFFGRF